MANKAVFQMKLTLHEVIALTGGFTDPTETHDLFTAISSSYTQGGSPDHDTSWSVIDRTVTTGDIDLTALVDSMNNALDLTGKFIHAIMIKCASGNSAKMTFQEHVTNGYGLFGLGSSVILEPGASILLLANGGNEAVSASAKVIDINGTGSNTFDMAISAGD